MLRTWRIDNFKSISAPLEIPLANINVLAGANSSGKSSLIQSILLIKQTLQSVTLNRPLVLNGPILGLGTFDDIKNSVCETAAISIGWDYEPDPRTLYQGQVVSGLALPSPTRLTGRSPIKALQCEFAWEATQHNDLNLEPSPPTDTLLKLQPRLERATLNVNRADRERRDDMETTITVVRSPEATDKRLEELGVTTPLFQGSRDLLQFPITDIDSLTARELVGRRTDADVVGCGFRHFWPTTFGVRYDLSKYRARLLAELICSQNAPVAATYEVGTEISVDTLRTIISWLEQQGASPAELHDLFELVDEDQDGEVDAEAVSYVLRRLRPNAIGILMSHEPTRPKYDFEALQTVVESTLIAESSGAIDIAIEQHRSVSEAGEITRYYFGHLVRYLGPLRDEPRSVYPREALADPTDVGYKGEFTAAVLNLNKERQIRYIPSTAFHGKVLSKASTSASLHGAVVDWLSYFGVATEFEASDLGKFGHQLQVQTDAGGRSHDLTHVGVGVSQVLPIVVMALLAPAGSLLIFEQPELHLHPKVQSRLADFFLSLAWSRKQCLVETHSEYMVERFRLRIAQATGNSIKDMVRVYFTDRPGGKTRFRPVEISAYGAIMDWPEDFFDQSQQETENILLAAAAKRMAKE